MISDTDRFCVGVKQSTKAVIDDCAVKAFIAHNAEKEVVHKFENLCTQKSIPVNYDYNMEELGMLCKITVGASVAVIMK